MRIIDRFSKYMEIKELNDNQVTETCVLSVGLLGKARKGESDLGKKAVDKILSFYQDLNRVWLLTGEGEMLLSEKKDEKISPQTAVGGGDVVMSREVFDQLTRLTEAVADQQQTLRSQQQTIAQLVSQQGKDAQGGEDVECAVVAGSGSGDM